MKKLRCRDAGFDCEFEIEAGTVDEILLLAAEHVQNVHGIEVSPDLVEQVKALIQEKGD